MKNIIDKAVDWAIAIAKDNTHGYSQVVRWGTDYDCSSLVISAFRYAGLKLSGATYTGNMYNAFINEGFKDVTSSVNLVNGEGLQKGDVCLNVANHTCLYIGDGKVVNARTDTDGRLGDSHGDEIRIQGYWNYNPWDYILRYTETSSTGSQPKSETEETLIPNGTKGIGIAMLQGGLKALGYNLGWYGIDGDAGLQHSFTNIALRQAVSHGEISKETVDYLVGLCKRGG